MIFITMATELKSSSKNLTSLITIDNHFEHFRNGYTLFDIKEP